MDKLCGYFGFYSLSRATKRPQTPAQGSQAEWRMRLCEEPCVPCPVLLSSTGPEYCATPGAGLEAGVPELKSPDPHAQLVSELGPGPTGVSGLDCLKES